VLTIKEIMNSSWPLSNIRCFSSSNISFW